MTPQIPQAELDRLEPLVARLLADLRQRTEKLGPERPSALVYQPAPEPAR